MLRDVDVINKTKNIVRLDVKCVYHANSIYKTLSECVKDINFKLIEKSN